MSDELTPVSVTPVDPVPVVAQTPSSQAQDESFVDEVVAEVVSLKDAAIRLVDLALEDRKPGDGELQQAVANVRKAVEQDAPQA